MACHTNAQLESEIVVLREELSKRDAAIENGAQNKARRLRSAPFLFSRNCALPSARVIRGAQQRC